MTHTPIPRRNRLYTGFIHLTARLPLPLNHALGALLGWLLYVFNTRARRVSAENLARCFPELAPAERQGLLRRSLIEGGKTLTELGPIWLWPTERTLGLVRQVSGQTALDRAMASGKGAIIAAPHLGCWELAGLYLAHHHPMTSLYRPPRQAWLEDIVRGARQRSGSRLVPTTTQGVRALYAALARGELIGILPDQDPGQGGGTFAPFFNIPANTMTLLSRLAGKSGAPVFLVYAERLAHGKGYHLHIQPTPASLNEREMASSVAALNQEVERCVRDCPAQYQWSYQRFKTRPPQEP